MVRHRRAPEATETGFAALRRGGMVSELLFLYDCLTEETPTLEPIARRLGLTVQAVSHLFRQLKSRGLTEFRAGRYRATVEGVEWLHATLSSLGEELGHRLGRLHVIRTTRATARERIEVGDSILLEMQSGLLTARRGTGGPSGGIARTQARLGELVEVTKLQGIVPIPQGRVELLVVPEGAGNSPTARAEVAQRIRSSRAGLIAAQGIDAIHLVDRSSGSPIVRFGVAAACAEASRLGVDALAVVSDSEVPRFLTAFSGRDPPLITLTRLAVPAARRVARPRRARSG